MMRITNKMMVNSLNRNINTNMINMDKYQTQLSTTRRINRPSDDPAGLVKSLRLRTNLNEGEQYLANIDESLGFLDTTDAALNNVNEIMQKTRELTVKAATDSNAKSDFSAIAKEIREMNDQLKMIANTTYGSKYVFAGSNVTEAPYQDSGWMGNQNMLEAEIGVGVIVPYNIDAKELFAGKTVDLSVDEASGINGDKLLIKNLQEGDYKIHFSKETDATESTAEESQSYLSAVPNSGSFFYEDMGTAATLGVGNNGSSPANNSSYSGSILVEATKVAPDSEQVAVELKGGSTKASTTLVLDKPLYMQTAPDAYEAIADDTELKDYFTYQDENGNAVTGAISSAKYDAESGEINFTFDISKVQGGDVIKWNSDVPGSGESKLYYQHVDEGGTSYNEFKRVDEEGHATEPLEMNFDNSMDVWKCNDNNLPQQLTVSIKAHLYTNDSEGKLHYKYVELDNVVIDPETAGGQQIFKIPADEINDSNFTEDLVIWNNSTNSLGGLDPDTSQLKAGDKTVISFSAQGEADYQTAVIDFSYTSATGEKVTGSNGFRFSDKTFDYETQELKFFTLNEETGLAYSGDISLETGVFGASDSAATFTWQQGLFSYMEDVARKIEAGKVTETSLQLGGNDIRMQELLTHRSTIGARVNRLELQQSRLESIQTTFTSLLSKTEDANIAEVIMQLQLQENVYAASLAAGARIIQPSLVDFLS